MKCVIKEDVSLDILCELRPGDLFVFENRPYIRIDDDFQYVFIGKFGLFDNAVDYISAVNLRTGEICHFNKSIRTRAVKDYNLDITI